MNLEHPRVLQLVMDSLRYWVEEMHVDGFRFDLAPTLARTPFGYDPNAAFLRAVRQDKLIAEPWDVGLGGYQVGHFPSGWSEWNDKYRDVVRRFWQGVDGVVPELASRLTGSSDLFDRDGRHVRASVNFVTAHDGFTLADLVSYNHKHNEANGEDNRDGTDTNHSWNCGVEGATDDPAVRALRARQQRNLLATLLLSHGTPMLLAGDELGKSQGGNNNAYAQDSPLTWLDWASTVDPELHDFTIGLLELRAQGYHVVAPRRQRDDGGRLARRRAAHDRADVRRRETLRRGSTRARVHERARRCDPADAPAASARMVALYRYGGRSARKRARTAPGR